jgi:DNA (cytosine-5)-methyltransferase 1
LKVLDLFSGAGGFSKGFEMAGFQILAGIESVEVYTKTHERNFPNSKSLCEDLSTFKPQELAATLKIEKSDVDVIIGGPPCQTFSTIGASKIASVSGKSLKTDARNYYFQHYLDFVDFYQPKAFVLENVPNLRSKYGGKLFSTLRTLAEDLGYELSVEVLKAVEFGVPQTRKRLFIVGTKKGRFEFPTGHHREDNIQSSLFEENYLPANTVEDAIGDLPLIYDGIRAGELPYSKSERLSKYQKLVRNSSGLVGNNVCRVSNERAKKVFKHMQQGDKYMDLPKEVRSILPFREDIFHDRLKRLVLSKPSWTVIAHIGMDGYMYIHPEEDRTLSVREAARIQSFPDDFEFIGNMREQYIQVGNAVPPLLAKAIGEALYSHLKGASVILDSKKVGVA